MKLFHITILFHIFKKRTKNILISIPVSIFSFVNDGLFVSQEKSYEKYNIILYCSYSIILSLFNQFGLVIEHNKLEVFYFSKLKKNTTPSLPDLRSTDGIILRPKDT